MQRLHLSLAVTTSDLPMTSSSSSSSSSEDEDHLAALKAAAVSFEQVTADAASIAKKASNRGKRRTAAGTQAASGDDADGDSTAQSAALDPIQTKIAALLDARIGRELSAIEQPQAAASSKRQLDDDDMQETQTDSKSKKKSKKQKQKLAAESGSDGPSTSGAAVTGEGADMMGLRFFRKVPSGVPARLPSDAPEPEYIQPREPGVKATERILAGTRYALGGRSIDEHLPALAAEADSIAEAAGETLKQLKARKEKPAAPAAAAAAAKPSADGLSGDGAQDGQAAGEKKKKKRKKKLKQEGVVVEAEGKPFVPHDQRMVALLGH